ncbi:Hydroxypyruvate isomerase [Fundidesulfovibrio magnetotacticus]|uniref:Hydroxypyruvate isomerase n=1 Tax=Fundidesulfovibrio magnetotacticus TaxID=2730080 RepID=A0A6V8LQL8_9BACT|nr:hydroxypyruvate isomerase [Fundidesulfovibrio magnetotacticus]GFK92851.1 Hydroxypyruvate isomerase [Fundidesulfovibrio magnetotacticus]
MPRFSANLTMLYTESPFEERFALAARSGFKAVEYLFPYPYEPERLAGLLRDNGLTQALFNLPAGDWATGDRGIAADPARKAEFRQGVERAVEYAQALGVTRVNCLAGKLPPGVSCEAAWDALAENAAHAADALAAVGASLLVEFINRKDIPGFFLHGTAQVLRLIDAVGRPNVFLQYDVYHAQREEGELTATLRANLERIGHVQIADNPGRHQPGTGEIDYRFLLAELDRMGYTGHVGLEYVPAPDTAGSLGWIAEYGYTP